MPTEVIVFNDEDVAEALSLLAASRGVSLPARTFQRFGRTRADYDENAWFVPKDSPESARLLDDAEETWYG